MSEARVSSVSSKATPRSTAPVFVLGCPRSGTTYLYHLLLSAGNFAIYHAESEVFHLLEPRFGDLSQPNNKTRLLQEWFNSRLFTATGLTKRTLQGKIMAECRNGGDFLRIVMQEVARNQGVARWAECTPDHILNLARIKQTIPDALIIHIIRDGRDAALSMEKQGWPKQLPWDGTKRRMAAGLYWEWIVRRGRTAGLQVGSDYTEVHYEDLINNPRQTLQRLGSFIDQELDYDQIQRTPVGSVTQPNTSFKEERRDGTFSPVGRWKKFYSPEELETFETLVGDGLQEFGYPAETNSGSGNLRLHLLRAQYHAFLASKLYFRTKMPAARFFIHQKLPQ